MNYLKKIIIKLINLIGYSIVKVPKGNSNYQAIYPTATYSPWITDSTFSSLYQKLKEFTLVDIYRCYNLYQLVFESTKITQGEYLEVGVWRGGTSGLITSLINNTPSRLYICDTFTGVVKTTENDPDYFDGYHDDTDQEIVETLLDKLNINKKNYEILKGIFPEDTQDKVSDKFFKFVHIDVDVYQSAKDIWIWIQPKLVKGAIVIFDDYGFAGCSGVTSLVNEIKDHKDFIFQYNLTGQAIFIKFS